MHPGHDRIEGYSQEAVVAHGLKEQHAQEEQAQKGDFAFADGQDVAVEELLHVAGHAAGPLTTARPKATTAENTMPMAVSAERLLLRRTTMTASPTSTPKSGMDSRGFTARIRPRATPAKAECPMASEKKAMRKLMTSTPSTAAMGVSSNRPSRACCP